MKPEEVTLLAALAGAAASFAGTALSGWFLLKKERESRRDQQSSDEEKWRREQLHATLLTAASQIDLYITRWLPYGEDLGRAQQDGELTKLSADVKKGIIAVLMNVPDKTQPEYHQLGVHAEKANHTAIILQPEAWAIRQLLINFAIKYGASTKPRA
jgi:hypothetical protein